MTKQGQGLKLHPFVQGWLLALGIAITGSPGIADELLDEPVETLEVIEVSGTALIQEKREISIPMQSKGLSGRSSKWSPNFPFVQGITISSHSRRLTELKNPSPSEGWVR